MIEGDTDHVESVCPTMRTSFGWGRRLSKDILCYAARTPALPPLAATSSRHQLGYEELRERRLSSWFPGEPSGGHLGHHRKACDVIAPAQRLCSYPMPLHSGRLRRKLQDRAFRTIFFLLSHDLGITFTCAIKQITARDLGTNERFRGRHTKVSAGPPAFPKWGPVTEGWGVEREEGIVFQIGESLVPTQGRFDPAHASGRVQHLHSGGGV